MGFWTAFEPPITRIIEEDLPCCCVSLFLRDEEEHGLKRVPSPRGLAHDFRAPPARWLEMRLQIGRSTEDLGWLRKNLNHENHQSAVNHDETHILHRTFCRVAFPEFAGPCR